MPDGRVLIVLALAGMLVYGTNKAVHGIARGGKAIGHAIVHVIHHQTKK